MPTETTRSPWPQQTDWRLGPFSAQVPNDRKSFLTLDIEHFVNQFTPLAFSLSVSEIWNWDIQVEYVGLSRRAALHAWRGYKAAHGRTERFSLEQLVWEGWDLPAVWIRNGDDTPHSLFGGFPVRSLLDPEIEEAGLAWLVRAAWPKTHPAYQRVHWADAKEPDPDLPRLEAIIADHARSVG